MGGMGGKELLDPRIEAERGELLTYEDAVETMVDVAQLWRKAPDRERSWQAVRCAWPDILRHAWRRGVGGEWDEQEEDPEPTSIPLTRDQVGMMDRVGEWLLHVDEEDRRLVVVAVAYLARGSKRVPWDKVWKRLGRGKPGPDGLRKRFGGAVTAICGAVNAEKSSNIRVGDSQP